MITKKDQRKELANFYRGSSDLTAIVIDTVLVYLFDCGSIYFDDNMVTCIEDYDLTTNL